MLPPPPISTLFPYTTLFRSPILPPVQLPRAPPRAGAPGPPPIAVRRLGHGASQIPARHAARDVDRALSAAPQDPRRSSAVWRDLQRRPRLCPHATTDRRYLTPTLVPAACENLRPETDTAAHPMHTRPKMHLETARRALPAPCTSASR